MEIFIAVIAFIVVVAGAISNHNRPPSPPVPPTPPAIENKVLSEIATPPAPPTLPTVPTFPPTPTPLPTSAVSTDISDYIYPGASVVSSSSNSLSLTSSADPDAITNWYKDKIQSKGFNSKAFAESKANDKVMNKLSGANGQISITIEISRESAGAPVQIKIGIDR